MRIPILTALFAAVLLCSPTRAGEDDPLAKILERLTKIEERLERIERKLAAWTPPPEIGPLSPEHRTPVDVAVVLDLRTLEVTYGHATRASPGRRPAFISLKARVKLLRAPRPVRGLQLSIFSDGALTHRNDQPWAAGWTPSGDEKWMVGEERTIVVSTVVLSRGAISHRPDLPRRIWEDLSGTRLHIYVDYVLFDDETSCWDTRRYWAAQVARLEQGMSFEAVREILPGYDKDVGVQAFPGKPVLRSWLLSPRWLVHVEFDKEGMTGKPVLIPVGPHAAGGDIGYGD